MATVKVQLYTHKTLKDGSHPVILSIIKDRKRKTISLGYFAKISQWNFEKNVPNSKHPHFTDLKNTLKIKLNLAEKAILDLDGQGRPYTVDDVANAIQVNRKSTSMVNYANDLINRLKSSGQYGNARVYDDVLKAFAKFHNNKDLDFKYLNYKVLKQFEEHLKHKGLKVNSISVHLRTIRAIFNKAIKEDVISDKFYPFKKFQIKEEPTKKRAISKEEIIRLKELDLADKPHLKLARDLFLFSFYNRGMNFIDIFYLQEKDIQSGRIEYRRRKTGKTFSIGITDASMGIINQYCKNHGPDSYIFPILKSDREYQSYRTGIRNLNKYLKEVGKLADINMTLSSYVARHSWATIAKRAGISTAIISEGMGHDTELTTQIYLDSFEDAELDRANEIIIG